MLKANPNDLNFQREYFVQPAERPAVNFLSEIKIPALAHVGVYDSLGEAYLKDGQKDLAIKNYEKSLELDPNNGNAKRVLKELKEGN